MSTEHTITTKGKLGDRPIAVNSAMPVLSPDCAGFWNSSTKAGVSISKTETTRATSLGILVVDDELSVRRMLTTSLETDGHRVVAVSNALDATQEAVRQPFDLAFVDLRLGADLGLDLIPSLLAQWPWMTVVIMTGHGSIHSAVETMKRGAADYVTKPFTPAQIRLITDRVIRLRSVEQDAADSQDSAGQIEMDSTHEGGSPAMQRHLEFARQLAASDTNVLLRGESGTGKGVLARAIHRWSNRSSKPFATVSCPTLSSQLLESELFGHVKGAFTSAMRDNPGRIAQCEGGTLFLDEIGDLPLNLQPKLLRFLQEREYERVGDSVTRRADVRIITATNVNIEEAVRAGVFREDLFYRINVVQIDIPPLRHRQDDIIYLSERFLAELRRDKRIVGFTEDAQAALRGYQWPGNVRELRNVIERAVIVCQAERIGIEHFPPGFAPQALPVGVGDPVTLDKIEEAHIRRILAQTKTMEKAAELLGINVATLWRRRKKYGI